jgi:hypothetical protein
MLSPYPLGKRLGSLNECATPVAKANTTTQYRYADCFGAAWFSNSSAVVSEADKFTNPPETALNRSL